MTIVFPANPKNSTFAVCRLYAEMKRFMFVPNVSFFPYFSERFSSELDKKITK